MKQGWILSSCLGLALAACVTPTQGGSTTGSTQPDKPAASNEPAQILFRAEVLTKSGEGLSLDAEGAHILHTGDKVAFYVTVTQPAYVYVGLHSSGENEPALLYPGDHDAQTVFNPGTDYRVPGMGKWLVLDQDTGQEDIFVYASRKALAKDEVVKLLASDRPKIKQTQAPKTKLKARPKPKTTVKNPDQDAPGLLAVRGLKMVETDPAEVKDGGITSKHFVIRHQK